jgi:hypothetical protein
MWGRGDSCIRRRLHKVFQFFFNNFVIFETWTGRSFVSGFSFCSPLCLSNLCGSCTTQCCPSVYVSQNYPLSLPPSFPSSIARVCVPSERNRKHTWSLIDNAPHNQRDQSVCKDFLYIDPSFYKHSTLWPFVVFESLCLTFVQWLC